jgi:hypothetical protein
MDINYVLMSSAKHAWNFLLVTKKKYQAQYVN